MLQLILTRAFFLQIVVSDNFFLLQIISLGWGHKVVRVWWGRSKNTREWQLLRSELSGAQSGWAGRTEETSDQTNKYYVLLCSDFRFG